LNGLFSYLFHH